MLKTLAKLAKSLSSLGLREESISVESLVKTSSFNKLACIIAAGNFGDDFCMLKNRDRNYEPKVKIIKEIIDGVEIAYLRDDVTGWVEGINEFGIGIVNSALMVGRDEKEKQIAKDDTHIVKDGDNMIKALKEKNIESAVQVLVKPKNKIYGHTLASDGEKIFSIEMTSKHGPFVTQLKPDKIHVRTNHGFHFPDAGYTEGPSRHSSVTREEKAEAVLQEIDDPNMIVPILVQKSQRSVHNPNNMVRDTENMSTNTQMLLNLDRKILSLYLMPDKVKYLGLENNLPANYKSKILVEVFEFDLDGKVATKPLDRKLDDLECEIFYFAYGSNMDEEQMKKRAPSSNLLGPAILDGYSLAFYGESKDPKEKGVASVVPKEGSKANGALYRIKKKDLIALDKYENSPKAYRRIMVDTFHQDYGNVLAQTYIHNKHFKQKPDKEYLKQISESYEDLGFDIGDILKNQK